MAARNLNGDDPHWTRQYVSPAKDFVFRKKIKDDAAARLAVATDHEQTTAYAGFKVSGFTRADEDGWQFVYYCKDRTAQEAYNWEHAQLISNELPELRQTWVLLRSEYAASGGVAKAAPPALNGRTWTFIGASTQRMSPEFDGLFIEVTHLYMDAATALISKTVDPELGDTRTSTRTLVAAGTEAVAVNASGEVTEIQSINTAWSWKTTRALAGLPALAGGTGIYEDSLSYEMNWSWPPVLNYIAVNAVVSDPSDAFSAVVGYNVVPFYLSAGYQGKCKVTETRRWTKKKPLRTGDAGWYWGATWATATNYTAGDFKVYADESYICLTTHTSGTFATDLAAVKWRVSSPLLAEADKLLEQGITFIGAELGRIQIPPCLHGVVVLSDSQTVGVYPATSPRFWPETILADVKLDNYPGGGFLTQEFRVDAPNADGVATSIELEEVSVGATSAVVQWTGQTTGSITATYLDVATDPDFGYGFLSGFNGAVVTPGTLGTPKQTTITGMTRGQPYYARIRRGSDTSNTERLVPVPQAEIALSSSGAIADGGTLAFGDAAVGSTNVTKTITITNDGLRNLGGLSVAFSGTNSGDWTVGALPSSVPLEDSDTFVVTCTPTATGSRTAVMTVTSNAPGNPSYVVNLTATGVNPEINVVYAATSYASGDAVPLAGTTYGGSSTDYTLTIENTGTGNLTVTADIVSADGSMTIQTAPTTPVAGSGSTTMVVRFTPTVDGGSSSVLTLTNNDANESSYVLTLQAAAICTGTLQVTNPLGVVAASGGTYEFGSIEVAVGTRAKTFVLTNSGVGELNSIDVSSNSASFVVTALTNTALSAAGTMNVTVTFKTVASNGVKTGTLTITSSDPVVPSYTMTLTATEVAAGVPEIQAESPVGTVLVDNTNTLDFGNVLTTGGTATKTLRLRNIGTSTLTGLASTATSGGSSGDFTHPAPTDWMATDASQDVTLTFNPSGHGPRSTTLNITSNDATEGTFEVALTGVGIPANALLKAQSAGVFIGQANATAQATTVDASTVGNPFGIAVSSTGRLAVVDQTRHRILIWNTVPTTSGVPADLVIGQTNFTNSSSGTTSSTLSSPRGVYWHGTALWVIDRGNNRVLRFTNPVSNGQAATLVIGQADFVSSAAATTATGMSDPTGICIYGGKLFVADSTNNRVLVYTAVPTSNGSAASYALGQASGGSNLTTATAATTAAGMDAPWGVAVTLTGKLMVVDRNNNRVLVYPGIPAAGGASASFALGQAAGGGNLTTNAAACTSGGMYSPYSVAVSITGQIAVADGSNHRVLIWYETPTSVLPAHAVLGQADFTSGSAYGGGSIGAAVMETPLRVHWTGNHLLVGGAAMHRVMKFSPA